MRSKYARFLELLTLALILPCLILPGQYVATVVGALWLSIILIDLKGGTQ